MQDMLMLISDHYLFQCNFYLYWDKFFQKNLFLCKLHFETVIMIKS
jgi:hypothetical protein